MIEWIQQKTCFITEGTKSHVASNWLLFFNLGQMMPFKIMHNKKKITKACIVYVKI